jgi:DNA-binding beta-propeller fold protein YncE
MAAAQTATDKLLKDYPDTNSTPMAYVLAGRLVIVKGHTSADVDSALASFERVSRLFPSSDAVPAAGYFAGETLRQVRRTDDAIAQYGKVLMEYPRSVWAARAALAQAKAFAQTDRATRALGPLQHVRQMFPGSPEAAAALDDNTIIYRLFVRAPAKPAYAFSGKGLIDNSRLSDVFDMAFDSAGHLVVGHGKGMSVFDRDKGTLVRMVPSESPDAFFVDGADKVVTARKGVLITEGSGEPPVAIEVPPTTPNGKVRSFDAVPSVAMLHNGDRLVVDHEGKSIARFTANGKYVGPFASVNSDRVAVSDADTVAAVAHDSKAVALMDRDGKVVATIAAKGAGYEFNSPSDLAFDPLGYLYVLDRGKPTVYVFSPKGALVATVTAGEKDPGGFPSPKALAVDGAGRILVYDDHAKRVQVFQ